MDRCFVGQNKELWGFSLNKDEKPKDEISKVRASVVQKCVHTAFEEDWDLHVLPHASIPFILIKTPMSDWHYFRSQEEAAKFRENILIDGYAPYWPFI